MGYKRAGFEVIGNVEIDNSINKLYLKNLQPTFNYNMDLREFNALSHLPDPLFELDILDGSPPCSVFSLAGQREKNWGKAKSFREGQKRQTLDDLFSVFLDTVEKLRPKIVVAENVPGLLAGNAKGYVTEIVRRFNDCGYAVQIFKLNSAFMDVPQTRTRVFFIANMKKYPKLSLDFREPPIPFKDVRSEHGIPLSPESLCAKRLERRKPVDTSIKSILVREGASESNFSQKIIHDDAVCPVITANGSFFRDVDAMRMSSADIINCSTFPQDYDFLGQSVQYVCGMSVPPNMMAHIAVQLWRQWLNG